MIAIKNADNKAAAAHCNWLSLPLCDVFEMTDRDEVLGIACALQEGETARLLYLDAPSAALVDALLRAALNAMLAKGARCALLEWDSLKIHALKKGYISDLAQADLKIKEFFEKSACKG